MSKESKLRHRALRPPRRPGGEAAGWGRHRASGRRRSCTTACSTAARRSLAHHHRLVLASRCRGELGVELVGLGPALRDDLVEAAAERGRRALLSAARGARGPQPQPQFGGFAGATVSRLPERALGAALVGVDGGRAADHMIADPVLGVRRGRSRAEQAAEVGLVLAKQRDRAGAVRACASEQLE